MDVICMFCKKEYSIDKTDIQYNKLVNNKSGLYICKNCNTSLQKESINSTGINPNQINKYDKYNL